MIDQIGSLNKDIAKFWSKSDGWAPVTAAGLLEKSRRGAVLITAKEREFARVPGLKTENWASVAGVTADQAGGVDLARRCHCRSTDLTPSLLYAAGER